VAVLLTDVRGAPLTPACRTALQVLAEALESGGAPAGDPPLWLEIEARRLLGLKVGAAFGEMAEAVANVLDRLQGVRLVGLDERSGERRAAALLAEWRLGAGEGGRKRAGLPCHLLVTPFAATILRSGAMRLRIDVEAARRLTGHAGALFALLQDRRSAGRWSPSLDELKARLGVGGRYANTKDFRVRVLGPAVTAINGTGALALTVELERLGRAVRTVHFRWAEPTEARDEVAGAELAGALAGEPPLVVLDRLARWLGGQALTVRRTWWRRARELGAPHRPRATDTANVGAWVGWVAEDMLRALAAGDGRPAAIAA